MLTSAHISGFLYLGWLKGFWRDLCHFGAVSGYLLFISSNQTTCNWVAVACSLIFSPELPTAQLADQQTQQQAD